MMKEIFEAFNQLRVMIIGDVMVDAYQFGKVERISPEAPVPVVLLQSKEERLGGAANVALNVKALGASVHLLSVAGADAERQTLLKLLNENGISPEGILSSKQRTTTVKTRIIGNQHQMLRIDQETNMVIDDADTAFLFQQIKNKLKETDVVIFSDYDKGVLHPELIASVIQEANKIGIPSVVDPKKRNFNAYAGVTLFKPNLKELAEGLQLPYIPAETIALNQAVNELKKQMSHQIAMVTLSEKGVYIYSDNEQYLLPAFTRSISDVSGAGDTVVSVTALCLALQLPISQIAGLSNLAGGLVCESLGVVPIDKEKLYLEAQNLLLN